MKLFAVVGTTLLLLLLGTGVTAYAQEEHPQDAKPQAQEGEKPKQEEAKPARPEKDEKSAKDKEEMKDENARRQEEPGKAAEPAKNDRRAETAETHEQHGGRIPDDKFRAHFGREHRFHIGHPTIVAGRPQFVYGGYTFVMEDPWPAAWGYNDAVYVDFIDGVYYLIDPVHPGLQIVVNVNL